ncbi:signal peptidase II [Chloroflexota bacterium]
MQRTGYPQGKLPNVFFFLIALVVVVADQLSKIWIRSNLAIGESLPETGLFRLTYIHNTGAAFGLFQGQSFALTIVALIGIVVLLVFALFIYRRFPLFDSRLGKPAFGLVLGGTVGNLIDRLRLGYVTDFIDIGIWPAFNIADSAIVVGVILFSYSFLSLSRAKNTDSSI